MNFLYTFVAAWMINAALTQPALTRYCQNYDIPVNITSENLIYGLPKFVNNFDLVDLVTDLGTRNTTPTHSPFAGVVTQAASYTIAATFCTSSDPASAANRTVLLATHGLAFDRSFVFIYYSLCLLLTRIDIGTSVQIRRIIALLTSLSRMDTLSSSTIGLAWASPQGKYIFILFRSMFTHS